MKSRWLWTLGALALLAAGGLAWQQLRPPALDAVTVQTAPLVRTLQFSARVATLSRVNVGSTITGRVARVLVDEGAQVDRGALLLQLETEELAAALAQARAAETQARARLTGLRSTGRSAAQAQLAQVQATVTASEAELERTRQLVARDFVSAARLDDVQRAVDVARAQRAGAQAQVRAIADNGTDVAQAQAQLAQSQAQAALAQQRLAQSEVRAPRAARVLSRQVEPGQIVQPGAALMSLALAGPTQLEAQVDERFLAQLRVGQTAAVVADAFPAQRFGASVLSIAPVVDAQRGAIEVKLKLAEQPPPFLREDMTLSVEVVTGRRDAAQVIPMRALRPGAGDDVGSVLVLEEGRAVSRPVRLGLRTFDAVEVIDGLRAGETVLLAGDTAPGRRVRPRIVPWKPGAAGNAAAPEDASATLTNAVAR
jgi:HlyD family secretion protein